MPWRIKAFVVAKLTAHVQSPKPTQKSYTWHSITVISSPLKRVGRWSEEPFPEVHRLDGLEHVVELEQ